MAQGVTGYIDFSANKYMQLRLHYSETYDIATNKSTVTPTKLQALSTSWYGYTYYLRGTITINGTTTVTMESTQGTHRVSVPNTNTWYDVTGDLGSAGGIEHNSDGTKAITISLDIYGFTSSGNGNSGWRATGSQSVTLATIPRTSSISVGNGTIGSALGVTINRASSAFTHTVILEFGSYSKSATGATTSASITPDLSWCNAVPNATSGTATVTCITYNGSTEIGRTSASITLYVPDSVRPSASLSVEGVSLFSGLYLQGRSSVKAKISASGAYGSTVNSYSLSGAGYSPNRSEATLGPLNVTGDITITGTVTDSRGRTTSATATITVIAYSKPSVRIDTCFRANAGGAADQDGGYIRIQATTSFASANGKNAISMEVGYAELGGSYYSGTTALISGSPKTVFGSLSNLKGYSIRVKAVDTVGETAYAYLQVNSSGNILFSGVAGKTASPGNVDTSLSDGFQVNGDLHVINGSIKAKGDTDWWVSVGGVSYAVRSGICYVRAASYGDTGLAGGQYTTIATLPEAVRPAISIPFCINNIGGTAVFTGVVDTGGKVNIYTNVTASYFSFCMCYPIM